MFEGVGYNKTPLFLFYNYMIVIEPLSGPYIIEIKSRGTIPSDSTITIYNKNTEQQETNTIVQVSETAGITSVRFNLDTAEEGDDYSFKIVCSDGIVHYRGKLFCTAQDPQNYKIDQGIYTYSDI